MNRVLKIFLVLGLTLGASFMSACDNNSTCTYDVPRSVYSQGSRNSARVFYPCDIGSRSGTFDATTVTGGAFNTKENMYWLAEYLRDRGDLVVIAVSASVNVSIPSYESAHKAGVGILKEANRMRSSPLYGKIGGIAVMGYSMGGAGALQAAHDLGDGIDAAIGLAPWSTSSNLRGIRVPTMVIVGSRDTTASTSMVRRTYNNIPRGLPRAYGELSGQGHLYWVNNNDGRPAKELILAWLKVYLSGDLTYQSTLFFPPFGIVDYDYNP